MLIKSSKDERGLTNAGWLRSKHSFSFGSFYDPEKMGFSVLRVINEDRVIPGAGFGTHPHNNMEIISYVLNGGLAHKDSMGSGSIIKPGDIQIMSAGSGVAHSEYNASDNEEVHFLQIWIMPNVVNQKPNYQQKTFNPEELHNKFRIVISSDGEDQSLLIRQDARMFAGTFDEGYQTTVPVNAHRRYWLQMARGTARINEEQISAGDSLAVKNTDTLELTAITNAEILLFDLP